MSRVHENNQLRQQVQHPSKHMSELLEANKKLKADLMNLQTEHRKLELKLQVSLSAFLFACAL